LVPRSGAQAKPFVFVRTEASARRLFTLNPAAAAAGLFSGQALADAQAIVPYLGFADADPAGDAQAMTALGIWALRYSPWVHAQLEADGTGILLIDIEGSEPLFGGEAALIQDFVTRLARRGIMVQAAAADTIGAAYAMARHSGLGVSILPRGRLRAGIAGLPVSGLRIGAAADALRRAGLKRIGDLMRIGRQALTARFGAEVILRLDQALGYAPEPLNPLTPPLQHRVLLMFLEPVPDQQGVLAAVTRAAADLARQLASLGLGARRLRLTLHRTDGGILRTEAGCASPSHDAAHFLRLFRERLKAGEGETDLGLGIEALTLEAEAEKALPRQSTLDAHADAEGDLDMLIDRLGSRLTLGRVQRLVPVGSHIPERAVAARPAAQGPTAALWAEAAAAGQAERPLLMLPMAEPAEVIAGIPDGPPKRFRWRRVSYETARAEGPERIAPEWWRMNEHAGQTRDYYRVEDTQGRRFWLYREGLFGEVDAAPRWFVHGVFA
jgi:protein ImuB